MSNHCNVNGRLIEGLYCEALVLSDEVRAHFDLSHRVVDADVRENDAQIALSCEALRTTTRMMHAIAWLLQHRAYLAGEVSEFRLRAHGKLSPDFPPSDPRRTVLLPSEIAELIAATEDFYGRLLRIDRRFRTAANEGPSGIQLLQARLGVAMAA
jgi:regulator of CtrA degradation